MVHVWAFRFGNARKETYPSFDAALKNVHNKSSRNFIKHKITLIMSQK